MGVHGFLSAAHPDLFLCSSPCPRPEGIRRKLPHFHRRHSCNLETGKLWIAEVQLLAFLLYFVCCLLCLKAPCGDLSLPLTWYEQNLSSWDHLGLPFQKHSHLALFVEVLPVSSKISFKHLQANSPCGIHLWPLGHISLCVRRDTSLPKVSLCWHQATSASLSFSLPKVEIKYQSLGFPSSYGLLTGVLGSRLEASRTLPWRTRNALVFQTLLPSLSSN